MSTFRTVIFSLITLVLVAGALTFVIAQWSFVFAKRIHGDIMEVERVMNPTAILGRATEAQIHSYSVLIKDDDGKLYAGSGDDRQWQVLHKGCRVHAVFYVYPPWELSKSGTYFNARVTQIDSCPPEVPSLTPPAPATREVK
jgi:hypothetical protein